MTKAGTRWVEAGRKSLAKKCCEASMTTQRMSAEPCVADGAKEVEQSIAVGRCRCRRRYEY